MSLEAYVEVQAYFSLGAGLTDGVKSAIRVATAAGQETKQSLWSCYAVNDNGNTLSAHFVTKDAASMIGNFQNTIGNLTKVANVTSCYVNAKKKDLDVLKTSPIADFYDDVEFYEDVIGYIRFKEIPDAVAFDFLYCVPFFTMRNGPKLEELKPFVERVEPKELNNVFYGFSVCSENKGLHCREAYVGAKGFHEHMASVGDLLGAFGAREDVETRFFQLFVASQYDADSLQEFANSMNVEIFHIQNGFRKVAVSK